MLRVFIILLGFTGLTVAKCPDWTLPWGTYSGLLQNNVCIYRNIRFASPPLGDLRFAAPEYPPSSSNFPADSLPDPSCIQMTETACSQGTLVGGSNSTCFPGYYGNQTEDCLFLDVYVPIVAQSAKSPLPVAIWIYGGGYVFGSKTQYDPSLLPFYSGISPVDAASLHNAPSDTSLIFVAGNYRLGAYGWLAGTYMEEHAQPNAGLLDQQAILNFVHDHIGDVHGDPQQISVWGESAGASSIMHHLAMPYNSGEPLPFRRAILQSPAYQWLWDRSGTLNDTFTAFAQKVAARESCSTADIACLRRAKNDTLEQLNQAIFEEAACEGIMPVGPSVDGKLVPELAPLRFMEGKVLPVDTIIVSHVAEEIPYSKNTETWSFIPRPIRADPSDETKFQDFLKAVFSGTQYGSLRANISKQYPSWYYEYDQISRAVAVITDASFTCHTRFILDRYMANDVRSYALDYSVLQEVGPLTEHGATHGSDVLPVFAAANGNYTKVLGCMTSSPDFANTQIVQDTAPAMQQYFTDHAIWGDPNHNQPENTWLTADTGYCSLVSWDKCMTHVMTPQTAWPSSDNWKYTDETDEQTASRTCDFWMCVAEYVQRQTYDSACQKLMDDVGNWAWLGAEAHPDLAAKPVAGAGAGTKVGTGTGAEATPEAVLKVQNEREL